MKMRKLVLIIADVALLAVCIIQGILKSRDGAKYFELKQKPDEITIVTPAETVHITLENDKWFLGEQKYPANNTSVQNLVDAISSIRALNKVASANENSLGKYEIVDGKKISVQVSKEGKILRSLEIGKEATAYSQAYITVDGGKDIFIASGTLRSIFDKSIGDLRSRVVWGLDKSSVNSSTITFADGKSWTASRNGSGENATWNIFGDETDGIEIDSEKIAEMFNSMATVTTTAWYSDNADIKKLGGNQILTAKVGYGDKTASITLYEIPSENDETVSLSENSQKEEPKYYATASETPYVFEIASYVIDKFNKKPQDIAK